MFVALMPSPIGVRRNFQVEPGVLTDGLNKMKLTTERRWLSIFVGTVAVLSTTWAFVQFFELHRKVEALYKYGIIIEIGPDQFELDARVGFGLIFSSAALISRRAARNSLIAAMLWSGFVELLFSGSNPFDAFEPLAHIATWVLLLAAIVLLWRKASLALISALGPLYLLINYVLWYRYTQQIRVNAGVPMLGPGLLDNTLYGAQWWHVLYLLLSLIMLVWMVRLILTERRNRERSLPG
jgi:hypothetical protein